MAAGSDKVISQTVKKQNGTTKAPIIAQPYSFNNTVHNNISNAMLKIIFTLLHALVFIFWEQEILMETYYAHAHVWNVAVLFPNLKQDLKIIILFILLAWTKNETLKKNTYFKYEGAVISI